MKRNRQISALVIFGMLTGLSLGVAAIGIGCANPSDPAIVADQAAAAQVQSQLTPTTQQLAQQVAAMATQPSGAAHDAATQAISVTQGQIDVLTAKLTAIQAQEAADIASLKQTLITTATQAGVTATSALPSPWSLLAGLGVLVGGSIAKQILSQGHTTAIVASTNAAVTTQSANHSTAMQSIVASLAPIASVAATALPVADQPAAQAVIAATAATVNSPATT